MEATCQVTGVVLDQQSAVGIGEADVALTTKGATIDEKSTGSSGGFIVAAPPGSYTLRVRAKGYPAKNMTVVFLPPATPYCDVMQPEQSPNKTLTGIAVELSASGARAAILNASRQASSGMSSSRSTTIGRRGSGL